MELVGKLNNCEPHILECGGKRSTTPLFGRPGAPGKTGQNSRPVRVDAQAGGWHYGEELRESDEMKAERIVVEELKSRRWDASELSKRRKGDEGKLAMARRLREETTMTMAWIAERLKMGTKTHLAHLFYWQQRNK